MFEADAFERVAEFDVHAEIVGVELELIARADGGVFLNVQRQRGDGAFKREPPVPVTRWIGLEIDGLRFDVGCGGQTVTIILHTVR